MPRKGADGLCRDVGIGRVGHRRFLGVGMAQPRFLNSLVSVCGTIPCCARNREFFRPNRELLQGEHGIPSRRIVSWSGLSCGMIEIAAGAAQLVERMLSRASSQGPALSGHVKIKFQL